MIASSSVHGIVAAVLALALGAAPAGAQPAGIWDDVIAAARREGEVVVYSGYISPLTHTAIASAFQKRYSVKVSYYTRAARSCARRPASSS